MKKKEQNIVYGEFFGELIITEAQELTEEVSYLEEYLEAYAIVPQEKL